MSLTAGTRLGSFEILSALGAGGMGEVYRARDLRLDRDVAIKILPESFATDPERLARFEREAKTLAALNHPHIAGIYGVEDAAGVKALVMELVEGEDLSQRIARGPIAIDEALPIAKQIAEALEAAHERGIIHRDLKPANIKITPDGAVKVLDFGLAKLANVGATAGPSDVTASPTITSPAMMTGVGVLLGTAAYMSPEQAKGREADKRSDIWAFGCVLYEMLTGQRPFDGEDVSDTLANVLKGEPPWNAVPSVTPVSVHRLLSRCLHKDPKRRLQAIGEARVQLEDVISGTAPESAPIPPLHTAPLWRRVLPWGAASVVGLLVGSAIMLVLGAPWRIPPSRVPLTRFTIAPAALSAITISPDGTRVAYVSGLLPRPLMIRAFDRLNAEPVRGVLDARAPFFSFDGRWLGFFEGQELKKMAVSGGPPSLVCRFTGNALGVPSWGPDDTIVFATSDRATGLLSVKASGGEPRVLTKPDTGLDHSWPFVLPSGKAILFAAGSLGSPIDAQVGVLDIETGQTKILIPAGSQPSYVDTGHLIYTTAGTLFAVRFDPVRLEVLSDPVPIVEDLATAFGSRAVFYSVSRTGTLAYLSAGPSGAPNRSVVWVSRDGREEPVKGLPPRAYHALRLSPDDGRVALDIRDQENDIWAWDFARATLTRVTFNPNDDSFPVWTPDGARIVSGGSRGLFSWKADGTGGEEPLGASNNPRFAMSFSPDAKSLVVTEVGTSNNLALLTMDGKGQTTTLVGTRFTEGLGEISPDGNWLAYQSNESGQNQIYVRPFPDVNSRRIPLSPTGGTMPLWARNMSELFYLDGTGNLTTVPIQTKPAFKAGTPTRLLERRYFSAGQGRSYDVSPDGQRFLMIKQMQAPDEAVNTTLSIVVVQNWFEELKSKVPTK